MKRAVAAALALTLIPLAEGSESLRATFETLQPRLASSPFGRPLVLESSEEQGKVRGDVFAVVRHPFREVSTGLNTPGEWCEVLILHLNVKACVAGPAGKDSSLQLTLGSKRANQAEPGQRLEFGFQIVESGAERFQVAMQADEGPLGTRDYQLLLKAIPLGRGQSFLHLAYAYDFSTTARLAMSAYLRTLGSSKVGFTVTGRGRDGNPVYVGGVRGALERNTMRYYLGIETVLASASIPPQQRRSWQLTSWFDATEAYARQLHELTRNEYLAGK